jgi:hypothetical protein
MDSTTLSTAEGYALRGDTSPRVTRAKICPEGDERRFAAVVLPYLTDAYALARRVTGNHADSEDVVQDAYCIRPGLGCLGVHATAQSGRRYGGKPVDQPGR